MFIQLICGAGMGMTDPKPQFSYLVEQLRKHKLAYIHVVEPMPAEITADKNSDHLRDIWKGVEGSTFISTNGHTRNSAIETADNKGGLVGFGRLFMPNVSHLFSDFFVTCPLSLARSSIPPAKGHRA
jgi:NADPH2 dehydrogenase